MSTQGKVIVAVVFCLLLVAIGWPYIASYVFVLKAKLPMEVFNYTTWFSYWEHYGQHPTVKKDLKLGALVATTVTLGLPLAMAIAGMKPKRELHGSARFANPQEVRNAGLYADKGIIVGKHQGKYLMFGGQQFVLMAAPTRAGKGVSMVIPNLLNYDGSVVVLDVKQENFDLTAGYRARHGQDVYLFNPFAEDGRTHRYNPLGYISEDPAFMVGDIQAIAATFYPADGKDPFWDEQARNLFLGLALVLIETPGLPVTIGEMLRQSSGKGKPIKDYLLDLIESRAAEGNPFSADCVDALNRFCGNSDNTLSSILSSFNSPLGIWANPIVDAATSCNDFDLRDVRKRKMSIYIGVTPDKLTLSARLINVFFSQLVNLNTKELPARNPELKVPCLLLMDEFTSIGKVAIIAKAVSYMAGYNLRLLPIIQSKQQLISVYGAEDAGTFITNHALHVIFAPREQKDAQDYSDMLGYETVKGKSVSRNIGGRNTGGRSESASDHRRALLLPQELRELGQWKQIVSLENVKPILCDKVKYFDDKTFLDRLKEVSPSLAALGRKKPNKDELDEAAFSGELSPEIPVIDISLYMAKVQDMTRPITEEDITNGIDIQRIAINTDEIPELDASATPEASKAFMDSVFASTGINLKMMEEAEAAAECSIEMAVSTPANTEPDIFELELDDWLNWDEEPQPKPSDIGIEDVPGEEPENKGQPDLFENRELTSNTTDETEEETVSEPPETHSSGIDLSVLDKLSA